MRLPSTAVTIGGTDISGERGGKSISDNFSTVEENGNILNTLSREDGLNSCGSARRA